MLKHVQIRTFQIYITVPRLCRCCGDDNNNIDIWCPNYGAGCTELLLNTEAELMLSLLSPIIIFSLSCALLRMIMNERGRKRCNCEAARFRSYGSTSTA